MEATVWLSPLDKCDNCGKPFGAKVGESRIMADAGALAWPAGYRLWGNFCDDCIADQRLDIRFGLGKGQRYELQTRTSGRAWYKVEG